MGNKDFIGSTKLVDTCLAIDAGLIDSELIGVSFLREIQGGNGCFLADACLVAGADRSANKGPGYCVLVDCQLVSVTVLDDIYPFKPPP
ncbi:hypothetical protein [Pseudomonas sp.]|uniref:hypothetical protein n=1 Tax=Pseudomonas sp. TaxID=306 RepID=UPI0028A8E6FF|nr:hypothetical protein [Pseudomonas sp.]